MPTDPAAAAAHAANAADQTVTVAPAVDVRVQGPVTVTDRPARSITTERATLAGNRLPVQILNAVTNRTRAMITQWGAEIVYIGGPGVTVGTGYPVQAGQSITLHTRGAVFAVADADGHDLRILSELSEG